MTILSQPANRSRDELVRLADQAVAEHGGPTMARVLYKYDCSVCRYRVTVLEPNLLPARARCNVCGVWTTIAEGGYLLQWREDAAVPWDEPERYVRKVYAHVPEPATSTEFER